MKSTRQITAGLLLAGSFLTSACTEPGIKATGTAEVRWGGAEPTVWTGTCRYSVETRWSTSLPHMLRLENTAGEALVIQSAGPLSTGRSRIAGAGEGDPQGLAMEGATVRGALSGILDVTSVGDTTRIDITGVRTHRETVPFEATCRLGAG